MLDAPHHLVKQKGRSIMAEVSDELLRQLLAQQPRASRQSWFGFIALLFVLCGAGWWAASNLSFDGVPVGTTVVPTIRAVPSRVPPVKRDAFVVVVQTRPTNTPIPPTIVPTRQPTPTEFCNQAYYQVDASGKVWCQAETPDMEATAQAWVDAPVSTNTALPAPGEPGFAASFQDAPECNSFIGYLGEDKRRCDAVYATQTAVAADIYGD